jgi:hypothetical protein
MMLRMTARMVVVLLAGVMVFGGGTAVVGQNPPGDIVCDSDLVLLWYVAERYFGFGAVQNTVAQTAADPASVLDVDRINQGQFAALFAAVRGAQDPTTRALPNFPIDANWLNVMAAVVQLDDASFQNFVSSMQPANFDTTGLVPLRPAAVAGEALECSRLRAQLHRFLTAISFQDVQSGFNSPFGFNANFNDNADLNFNTNDNSGAGTAPGNLNGNTNDNVGGDSNDNDDNDNDNDNDDDDDDDDDDDNSGSGSSDDDDD